MVAGKAARAALWGLVTVSALGLGVAVAYYFVPEDGIDGSLGVLLVVASTALMLIAGAAIALGFARARARGILAGLILLDIVGTGLAAYMLEAHVLIALMALALVSWPLTMLRARPFYGVEAVS